MKLYKIDYCENDYCIYCISNECSLDGIVIDSGGHCDSCIVINIDKKKLDKLKDKQLKNIGLRK